MALKPDNHIIQEELRGSKFVCSLDTTIAIYPLCCESLHESPRTAQILQIHTEPISDTSTLRPYMVQRSLIAKPELKSIDEGYMAVEYIGRNLRK